MRYARLRHAHTLFPALAIMVIALAACGTAEPETTLSPQAETGRRATQVLGCAACHGMEGQGLEGLGPTWRGLFGTDVVLADGRTARVDRDYLQRSILEPDADIVAGYMLPMPPYDPTEEELNAILAYLVEIR